MEKLKKSLCPGVDVERLRKKKKKIIISAHSPHKWFLIKIISKLSLKQIYYIMKN